MTTTLHRTGSRGGGVTLMGQALRIAIQLAGVVLLSRLLTPDDFGLVAMVAVFMTLADLFRDFGMPSAALQAKTLSHQQASNMFWASTTLGALSALVLTACTPLIVMLYGEPRLAPVIPAMATSVLVSGLQAQIQVQLARNLRFGILAFSNTLAPAMGLLVAILAALGGLGYWALVLQLVTVPVVCLAVQAPAAGWRPTRPRRGHGSKRLFISGAQLGAAYFLTWAAGNVDTMVVGARWGATNLGFYSRAWQVAVGPMGSLLSPLTQVALPMLNSAEKEGRRSFDMLLRLQSIVAMPVIVLMLGLALTAPSLIPLVLGAQWTPSIQIVQILAVGECIHALSFISYWGFLAGGLSKQLLYYNLVTKSLGVMFVLMGSFYGMMGVAWAYVAGLAVSWPINLVWLSRSAGLAGREFLRNGIRILLTGVAVAAGLQGVLGTWMTSQSWGAVVIGSICMVAGFVGLLAMTPTGRADLRRVASLVASLR